MGSMTLGSIVEHPEITKKDQILANWLLVTGYEYIIYLINNGDKSFASFKWDKAKVIA